MLAVKYVHILAVPVLSLRSQPYPLRSSEFIHELEQNHKDKLHSHVVGPRYDVNPSFLVKARG